MRTQLTYAASLFVVTAAAAVAIAAAPTAAAAPTPPHKSCAATGPGTTCPLPGNVEVDNAPPEVIFYPYGNVPFLLGRH
jgi:hypothetical protein